MTPMLVIDASVGAKWFLPEDDSHKADKVLKRGIQLVAPDIFRIEIGSAITRKVRRKLMSSSEAQERCEQLLAMLARKVVLLLNSAPDFPDALMLSLQLNHAVADCLYLALAQRLKAPLVTADTIFYEKAKPLYAGMEML